MATSKTLDIKRLALDTAIQFNNGQNQIVQPISENPKQGKATTAKELVDIAKEIEKFIIDLD